MKLKKSPAKEATDKMKLKKSPAKEAKPKASAPAPQPSRAVKEYKLGSNKELEEKVRSGKVVIGRLRVFSRYTLGLAFVGSPMFPSDVVVNSVENRKYALHGDIVAVELLPEESWQIDSNNDDVEANEGGFRANKEMPKEISENRPITRWVQDERRPGESSRECQWAKRMSAPAAYEWNGKKPVGVVVALIERSRSLFVAARLCNGALQPNEVVKSNHYYKFSCFDPLLPDIAVFGRDIPVPLHEKMRSSFFFLRLVTKDNGDFYWTAWKFLTGKVESLLGNLNSIKANSFALCNALGISMDDFSEEAYACVPETFVVPDKEELRRMGRRDLREEEFVCSIDPATARDLDDALSISRTPGGYRVGVHIADVSYFVPTGSALDEEARERSTSVYLTEQVIPMLPRKLSEEYCSLNTSADKFAFSCIFHLDHHGTVTSEWFGQSVIRNRCRLTYEEAQRILEGDETVYETLDFGGATDVERLRPKVSESIQTLFEVASKLREFSLNRGRLTIGNVKIRFLFEDIANPTFPEGFAISRQIQANWLVEEFMLLANARVAEKIVEYMPDQALLRRHEPPDRKRVATLKEALAPLGLQLQGISSKSIQTLLDKVKDSNFNDSFCVALKYVLQQAEYFVNCGEESWGYSGHYALALQWYTHFTSPIRRYCDMIVHRQLLCALEIESLVKGKKGSGRGKQTTKPVSPGSIDPKQLSTRNFFYPISEVECIVTNANEKKLRARQASDSSTGIIFCFYIKALQRAENKGGNAEGGTPFIPRVRAMVVRVLVRARCFTLFSSELAQEWKVELRDKQQRFKQRKSAKETKDDAADDDDDGDKKKMKTKKKTDDTEEKNDEQKLFLDWGPHPVTGEPVVEELMPMMSMSAVLTLTNRRGYEELKMIVDPPWEREREVTPIPTMLSKR